MTEQMRAFVVKILLGSLLSLPIFLGAVLSASADPTPAPSASASTTSADSASTGDVDVAIDTAFAAVGGLIVVTGTFVGIARRDRTKQRNQAAADLEARSSAKSELAEERLLENLRLFSETAELLWLLQSQKEIDQEEEKEKVYKKLLPLKASLDISASALPKYETAIKDATSTLLHLLSAGMKGNQFEFKETYDSKLAVLTSRISELSQSKVA